MNMPQHATWRDSSKYDCGVGCCHRATEEQATGSRASSHLAKFANDVEAGSLTGCGCQVPVGSICIFMNETDAVAEEEKKKKKQT